MTKTEKKRAKLIKALAQQSYNPEKTIGPRQTAVISDMLKMNIENIRCTEKELAKNHPASSIGTVLFTLRLRGLIKHNPGRGRAYQLTAAGFQIAMSVHNSVIQPGLGVVAVGVRHKK